MEIKARAPENKEMRSLIFFHAPLTNNHAENKVRLRMEMRTTWSVATSRGHAVHQISMELPSGGGGSVVYWEQLNALEIVLFYLFRGCALKQ